MSRLNERASSLRQEKRNQHSPSRAKILVFVEGVDDISFWHGILSPYEKNLSLRFDISPYHDGSLTTGKDKLKRLFPNVGKEYIICLDSDYDYLTNSEIACDIEKKTPYIFQTYAYSPENLKCYAESLNDLIVVASRSTDDTVDFAEFLKKYSQIIYPLLVWNIYYFKKQGKEATFSIAEFGGIVTFNNIAPKDYDINLVNYQDKLKIIENTVSTKLAAFTEKLPPEFETQLNNFGLNETNAYLFMRGHCLYGFIEKFLTVICEKQLDKHKKLLENLANGDKKSQGIKTGEYKNAVKLAPITAILASNEKFTDCFLFKKITADIENYMATFKQHTQGLNYV